MKDQPFPPPPLFGFSPCFLLFALLLTLSPSCPSRSPLPPPRLLPPRLLPLPERQLIFDSVRAAVVSPSAGRPPIFFIDGKAGRGKPMFLTWSLCYFRRSTSRSLYQISDLVDFLFPANLLDD